MTRINCGIPPQELSDRHLLAEHREIKRIPNNIKRGKYCLKNIPVQFTLGTGHVKFFYNKLYYLHRRYGEIFRECMRRGFNVSWYGEAFENVPEALYNDYFPTDRDRSLIIERINSKK